MRAFTFVSVAVTMLSFGAISGCEQQTDYFVFHTKEQITALGNYAGWELVATHGVFSGPYRAIGDWAVNAAPDARTPGSFVFLQRPGVDERVPLPDGHSERLLGRYENRQKEQYIIEFKRPGAK